MKLSKAERYQIENEMLFRRKNERVGDDLVALDAEYIEKNEIFLMRDEKLIIEFKCECSDETCQVRLPLKLAEYQEIHKNRDTFIVQPNHQVDPIETVISANSRFNVVKKHNSTPDPKQGQVMRKTTIDNSKSK